jgi:nucleoid DNA-binding protein
MNERDAAALADGVFDHLKNMIAEGNRVELRGFGVFQPRSHITKIGFNPKTGERIAINAGRTVKFRPSVSIIKEMNE